MDIKDLKVGDKVFIREDLEHATYYGGHVYFNNMGKGLQQLKRVYWNTGSFTLFNKGCYFYTSEMVDWEKTRRLKLNESWENIKKEIRGDSTFKEIIFKEIIQSGESGNEVTKATTYDGREITVKNNNEENDVEKAVMLLMLKKLGVTYGDIKRETEKVKVKWIPAIGEQFYYVSTTPTLRARALTYFTEGALKEMTDAGNCFETRKDAEEKIEKIKEVLRGE